MNNFFTSAVREQQAYTTRKRAEAAALEKETMEERQKEIEERRKVAAAKNKLAVENEKLRKEREETKRLNSERAIARLIESRKRRRRDD